MSKVYKVIWFDDEHRERKKIRESAHLKGITLVGFGNAEEGINELKNNIRSYDAALLDGIFYRTPYEKGTPTEDDAMGEVAMELVRLEGTKKLPWFILSGQDSFTKEKNHYAESFKKGQVFDKLGSDEHYSILWQNIKEEADKNLDTRIRHKYPNIINLCTDEYIGAKHWERIFKILENIEEHSTIIGCQDMLNPIRKIIEAVFSKLNRIGIIPDQIINGNGWISGCSLFLANKHNDFYQKESFIPPIMAENIYRLLNLTQDASHNEGNRLGVDGYLTHCVNNFLYLSAVYLLLDILDWTKRFIDQNPDKAQNILKWEAIEIVSMININQKWIAGIVTKIAENGWGTFQDSYNKDTISIPPTMVQANLLKEQDAIEILTTPSPDNTKTYIKEIKK